MDAIMRSRVERASQENFHFSLDGIRLYFAMNTEAYVILSILVRKAKTYS